jgi:hypothetical protein
MGGVSILTFFLIVCALLNVGKTGDSYFVNGVVRGRWGSYYVHLVRQVLPRPRGFYLVHVVRASFDLVYCVSH